MKIKNILRTILISSIVLLNVGCDQISKELVRNKIDDNQIISIVKDNIVLTKVENTGAALSFGSNLSPVLKTVFLQLFPVLVLLFLFRMIIIKTGISKLTVIGLAFVIGGGIGNIYDRILYGSVTDFMHINLGIFKTGIFNMADVSVVIGTILILIEVSLKKKNSLKISL